MSFTTLIFDSNIQLDNLNLSTKPESYAFGRRLYRCQIKQQQYWLKFHLINSHEVLEQAFERELNFYQQNSQVRQNFLLPHQIIPLSHIKNDDDLPQCGVGLLSVATNVFFSPIQVTDSIQVIYHKILTALQAIESMHQLGCVCVCVCVCVV